MANRLEEDVVMLDDWEPEEDEDEDEDEAEKQMNGLHCE
jgi:hypothetical protein